LQFKARFNALNAALSASSSTHKQPSKKRHVKPVFCVGYSSDESNGSDTDSGDVDPEMRWKTEFDRYVNTREAMPEGMSIVQWWGVSCFPMICRAFTKVFV
jgi:hypothetical protein